jgi:transcription elongation factor Elf1
VESTRVCDAGPLQVACPRCGHAADDDFEVVDQNRGEAMRCSSCDLRFHFLVKECERCGDETVFRWILEPTATTLDALACASCTLMYRNHGIDETDAD